MLYIYIYILRTYVDYLHLFGMHPEYDQARQRDQNLLDFEYIYIYIYIYMRNARASPCVLLVFS
jgi:hypothetical protein